VQDKAIRGVPWTLLSYSGSKVISVVTTLVLARLVAPSEFGLLALATLAVSFLNWIADMGFSGTVVLRHDLDARGKGTLLTMMAISGVVAGLIAVAVAPLAARVFNAPQLTLVLCATAALLPLGSIAGFWEAILQRELEFRRRCVALIAQSAVSGIVAIPPAAVGFGVWALVLGQVAGMATLGLVLFLVAPYHVRPAFDRAVARSTFSTSSGFLSQGLTMYIRQNVDTVTVGATFSTTLVGFYSMAYRLGDLVYWTIAHPVAKVTFPAFARSNNEGGDVRPAFLRVLGMVALVSCPIGILMSAAAEPFTRVVFGTRWLPMVGPLAVMGLWAAVRQMDQTIGWLLNSVGRAGAVAWLSVFILIPLIAGCIVASQIGGLTAVALVPLGDTLLSVGISSVLARRYAGVALRSQWRAVRPAVLASVPTWLTTWGVAKLIGTGAPLVGLLLSLATGLLVYGATLSLLEPGILRQTASAINRMMGRTPAPSPTG
jgi:O-antigen/teichoic acid export membrane protein